MTNIGKIFKRADKNKTAYHEIKVIKKLYEYQSGVKVEDTASCPAYYLCERIYPAGNYQEFLVAEENFSDAYELTKQQGELI